MKNLTLLTALLLSCSLSHAQSWFKNVGTGKPVKLSDVVEAYERAAKDNNLAEEEDEDEPEGLVKEGKNYHFSRWLWYWQQHLDENGYLVSPLQNWIAAKALSEKNTAEKTTAVDQSSWSFGGPDNSTGIANTGLGRINVVSFHPTDSNIFWIGSAGGGAWKTADGGLHWTVVDDNLPVLGVSDIDFNPLNPNTIYLCTGDRDAKDNFSVGVLKSTDGGQTWNTTGLKWQTSDMRLTHCLVINPLDTNSLTLGASDGIYKSYDGGATWQNVTGGEFKQVVYNPADTNILYAAGALNIYRSADGGASWQQTTTFTSNVSRIVLAVSPASPKLVKAIIANSSYGLEGIYRSADSGKTFTQIFDDGTGCSTNILASTPNGNACGGQGWYDLSFAMHPADTNKLVVGGVNTWYSTDGGYSWTLVNQWNNTAPGIIRVHADKHYHAYNPIAPAALYECNDGGIFKTYAPQSSLWTNLTNGLAITEFYRNAVSANFSFVIGGAQDNGTKKLAGPAYSELTGGDGMNCEMDYSDNKIFYTASQYGSINRTLNGGSNYTSISNNIPGKPQGDWITPYVIHPFLPNQILAGYNRLYASSDRGTTWTSISNTFAGNATRIAISPSNPDYIYVVAGNNIYYSYNYGGAWKTISNPYGGTISDICVDPKNEHHVWVSFNGYTPNKVGEYDSATGWTKRNEQLPNIPVNCIAIDSSNGTVYIGTDIGVFYRDYNVIEWVPFKNNLPTVEISDLGINYGTKEIWAATYGRGMWKSPMHDPSQTTAIQNIPLAKDNVVIAPNPNNGQFAIHTANKALQGKTVKLRIIGMNGAVAWQHDVTISETGDAFVHADLPRGSYIVEVNSNNLLFARQKMIVY